MSQMHGEVGADSPEVSRRRVRNILRDAREKTAGITQQQAADRMLWSLSKLIRVENGPNPPPPADVRVLMLEYGASEERVAEVVEFAKVARQPDQWAAYGNVYSTESRSLFANEPAARTIQKHEPSLVPGLLQTEDYARALLKGLDVEGPKIEPMIQVRLQRQEILESEDSPALDFVLGEASLSRPIGGAATMRAQLEHLKKMSLRPNVTLRILPFSAGPYPGMGAAFTVLEFRDPELPDLLYVETGYSESVVRDNKQEVDQYLQYFSNLQEFASPPQDFIGQLDVIVESLFQA